MWRKELPHATIEAIYQQKRLWLSAEGPGWHAEGIFKTNSELDYLETAADYEHRTGHRPIGFVQEWQPPDEWRCGSRYRLVRGSLMMSREEAAKLGAAVWQ